MGYVTPLQPQSNRHTLTLQRSPVPGCWRPRSIVRLNLVPLSGGCWAGPVVGRSSVTKSLTETARWMTMRVFIFLSACTVALGTIAINDSIDLQGVTDVTFRFVFFSVLCVHILFNQKLKKISQTRGADQATGAQGSLFSIELMLTTHFNGVK
jgi:hypothetical protein